MTTLVPGTVLEAETGSTGDERSVTEVEADLDQEVEVPHIVPLTVKEGGTETRNLQEQGLEVLRHPNQHLRRR